MKTQIITTDDIVADVNGQTRQALTLLSLTRVGAVEEAS